MIDFDYDSLMTYMRCPLKYKFEYLTTIETEKQDIRITFKDYLHKTIKYFFKTVDEEEKIPTQKELEDYFSDLWFADLDQDKVLYGHSNEKSKFTKRGYSYLKKFHLNNKYDPGQPIGIDLDYSINYMDQYNMKGSIELIREKDEKIQIVNFSTSRYKPDDFRRDNDISFTLDSYAFRKIFEKKEDEVLYYHLRSQDTVSVYRTQNDYDKLLTIINNIYQAINEELFYPRISYRCKSCSYNQFCTEWSGE